MKAPRNDARSPHPCTRRTMGPVPAVKPAIGPCRESNTTGSVGPSHPACLARLLSPVGTGHGVNHSRDANTPLRRVENRPLSCVAIQVAFNELLLMAATNR